MADIADQADTLVAEHLALSLSRFPADIPAGVAGECEECGEDMPRLVAGRCGFCRDGRRPPVAAYERPGAARSAMISKRKEPTMGKIPTTSSSRTISVPVEGALLQAIERHAAAHDLPLGRAVRELAEARLHGGEPHPIGATPPSDLGAIPLEELLGAVSSRLNQLVDVGTFKTAVERYQVAEDKLASITKALSGE